MKLEIIITAAAGMLTLVLLDTQSQAQSVNIALSTVGNPGNTADSTGYGSVSYSYDIGTYDVTLNQYSAFLNAVAKTDQYGLYDTALETDQNIEGITQTGASGNFSYSVIGNSGDDPVTYVSWFDAARFTNWLANGQPTTGVEGVGTTETGSYTLNGDTSSGLETRNAGAKWVIPSENEWYKAAYYDPNLNGYTGGYWQYAMRTNSAPGNQIGGFAYQANYIAYYGGADGDTYSVTESTSYSSSQQYLTPVGSYTNSQSAYGTFDQNGDVWSWNDGVYGTYRDIRGSAWNWDASAMQSANSETVPPSLETSGVGFRVAYDFQAVPEPSTWAMLIFAFAGVGFKRKAWKGLPTLSNG